jgi:hypothetical protein
MEMNKKVLLTAAIAAALGLPLVAQADETTTNSTTSTGDYNSAWWSAGYFELDGGQAHFANRDNQQVSTGTSNSVTNVNDNDTGWRANLGYQFNPWFSLELSYVDFGSVDDNIDLGTPSNSSFRSTRKAHAYGVAGVGSIPFGDSGWSGFLRLGTVDAHTQVNDTSIGFIPAPSSNTNSNDWKAYYGVGVAWQFAEHWAVRLGWDQYHDLGNANTVGETNIDFTNIGLQVRF